MSADETSTRGENASAYGLDDQFGEGGEWVDSPTERSFREQLRQFVSNALYVAWVRWILPSWSRLQRLELQSKETEIELLLQEAEERGIDVHPLVISGVYSLAWEALRVGDGVSYWRQFGKIREWELKAIATLEAARDDDAEAVGTRTLRDEAQRILADANASLPERQRQRVEILLTAEQAELRANLDYQRVYSASRLLIQQSIDDYHRRAQRAALRTQFLVFIATTLASVGLFVLVVDYEPTIVSPESSIHGLAPVLTVVLFGFLGASVSGLLSLSDLLESPVAPKAVGSLSLAVGRIVSGTAGALVVYVFLLGGFVELLFRIDHVTPAVAFATSFLAGFSERLFLRTVESVSGERRPAVSRRGVDESESP